jgi:hypothetical protein
MEALRTMGNHLVCPYKNCGKGFEQPVLFMKEARCLREMYYACPHCHSKVDLLSQNKDFSKVKAVASVDVKAYACREARPENCSHYIGYLKTQPENMPLPEECLTCQKVLLCHFSTDHSDTRSR